MKPGENNNSSSNIVVCVKNPAAASVDEEGLGGWGTKTLWGLSSHPTTPLSPLEHAVRKQIWGDTNYTHARHSQQGAFCSIPDTHTLTHTC